MRVNLLSRLKNVGGLEGGTRQTQKKQREWGIEIAAQLRLRVCMRVCLTGSVTRRDAGASDHESDRVPAERVPHSGEPWLCLRYRTAAQARNVRQAEAVGMATAVIAI